MNLFMEIVKTRGRGRPRGRTAQGAASRELLYRTAVGLMAERGYETTTLRDVAQRAGVSVGLLYRYFPSKRAVILGLYDELSAEYVRQAAAMSPGTWRERFLFALKTSLRVLEPHRTTLQALIPVLVGDPEEGLFAERTRFSRLRVQGTFEVAITEATDTPRRPLAAALGRLLYLVHLTILLWWLLDRSSGQGATTSLIALVQRILPGVALTLRLPGVRRFALSADELLGEALLDPPSSGASGLG
jgi:AcrR family transcriptional regulator